MTEKLRDTHRPYSSDSFHCWSTMATNLDVKTPVGTCAKYACFFSGLDFLRWPLQVALASKDKDNDRGKCRERNRAASHKLDMVCARSDGSEASFWCNGRLWLRWSPPVPWMDP